MVKGGALGAVETSSQPPGEFLIGHVKSSPRNNWVSAGPGPSRQNSDSDKAIGAVRRIWISEDSSVRGRVQPSPQPLSPLRSSESGMRLQHMESPMIDYFHLENTREAK